jgi:hypothetical protein
MAMSEILDYDKTIFKTIHHIEDINVKFALQNYAAAGAVFAAYFAEKIPLDIFHKLGALAMRHVVQPAPPANDRERSGAFSKTTCIA